MSKPVHWLRQLGNDMRDEGALEFEATALREGRAGILFEYHCFRCHRGHYIWSAMGQRHEGYGNPVTVRAAKKEGLLSRTRDIEQDDD